MTIETILHGPIDDLREGKLPWFKDKDTKKNKNRIHELENKLQSLEAMLNTKDKVINTIRNEFNQTNDENKKIIARLERETNAELHLEQEK